MDLTQNSLDLINFNTMKYQIIIKSNQDPFFDQESARDDPIQVNGPIKSWDGDISLEKLIQKAQQFVISSLLR